MRNFLSLLILAVLFSVTACKKDLNKDNPINPDPNPVEVTTVSPTFDWNMQDEVTITITNAKDKFIVIAPINNEEAWLKFVGKEETITRSIKMAKTVEMISINGNEVPVVNNAVNYAMPHDFKSVATAAYALDFDQSNSDYVETGDPGITNYPLVMEAWFKTTGSASEMTLMSYCDENEDGYGLGVLINSAGNVVVRTQKGDASTIVETTGTTNISDDEWHHAAVVFVAEDERLLYLNGNLEFTDNNLSAIAPSEVNLFTIGRWGDNTPGLYFDGLIDEVRLWNVERSAGVLNFYKTRSVAPSTAGLIGYWSMEEGSGATTANLTSTPGLDGTLASPAWAGNVDTDGDGVPNINDDYPHDPERAFNNYWPATPYTLAFEDLWPSMGDYDLNDMVIRYRFNRVTNSDGNLVEAFGNFTLVASGASLGKAFGFELTNPAIAQSDFSVFVPSSQKAVTPYLTYNGNGTEADQDNPVIIVHEALPNIGNTMTGTNRQSRNYTVRLDMIATDKAVDYFDFQNWNPFFILYVGHEDYDRRRELHLPGYWPTSKAMVWDVQNEDPFFDSINDGSNYPTGGLDGSLWYKTNEKAKLWSVEFGQYFPWGLDIPAQFQWAIESDAAHDPDQNLYRFTLKYAYDEFELWAGSNGATNQNWYENISDTDFIYQP